MVRALVGDSTMTRLLGIRCAELTSFDRLMSIRLVSRETITVTQVTGETPRNHRYIALEGGDGSGKTTLSAALAARLRSLGDDVVEVREPGGTPLGRPSVSSSWTLIVSIAGRKCFFLPHNGPNSPGTWWRRHSRAELG